MFQGARGIMGWLGDCAKVCYSIPCIHMYSAYSHTCTWRERERIKKCHVFSLLCNFMVWLRHLEQIIASENQPVRWTTPLGLPVVQPYRKLGSHIVSAIEFSWNYILNTSLKFSGFLGFLYTNKLLLLYGLQIKTSLQILTLQRETDKVSKFNNVVYI